MSSTDTGTGNGTGTGTGGNLNVKPIIAIDIDEVLALFIPMLAQYHNELYGTTLTVEHFDNYEFHQVWGGTIEDCNYKVDTFFQSPHIHILEPVVGAFEALSVLQRDFALHVVTARQHRVEALTRRWVARHYPGVFEELHFGNHYSTDGVSRSKPAMCRGIGALLLVDDSIKYAKHCAAEGIPTLLFGEYPWNQPVAGDEDILSRVDPSDGQLLINRVTTWKQVVQRIHGKFPASVSAESISLAAALSDDPSESATMDTSQSVKRSYRIAALQLCSGNEKEANLAAIERLVAEAADHGSADLVCLPECAIFIGQRREDILTAAEPLDDTSPSLRRLRFLAAQHRVFLSVGGFPERPSKAESEANDKVFNTHVIIGPDGRVISRYRKIHLFDSPLAGLFESSVTASGRELVVANAPGLGRLGLSICYDLRFPGLYARLCGPVEIKVESSADGMEEEQTIAMGCLGNAEVVLVPSAFTVTTGQAHWEVLLRSRAIENQVYVVAAAQSGNHRFTDTVISTGGESGNIPPAPPPPGRVSYGHSMIVDPWGKVLAECREEGESVCYADFERDVFEKIRSQMPVWVRLRPCYSVL